MKPKTYSYVVEATVVLTFHIEAGNDAGAIQQVREELETDVTVHGDIISHGRNGTPLIIHKQEIVR